MREKGRKYTVRADYESKIQRLLLMLKGDEQRTVKDLADLFGVTERSVYNMIDELNLRDIQVSTNGGVPRLSACLDPVGDGNRVFLASDEADVLLYLIQHLTTSVPGSQSLTSSLGRELKDRLGPYFNHIDADLCKVSRIGQALRHRKRLLLRGYRSGNSQTIADRLVEPVGWSANYRQLFAYDVDKRAMRAFVVSRMDEAVVLDQPWQHQAEHRVPEVDCFWMGGTRWTEVDLDVSLMALNLLHEEYPLSQSSPVSESGDDQRPYRVRLRVLSPKGVGRFVMGLGRQVRVAEGDELRDYINQNIQQP